MDIILRWVDGYHWLAIIELKGKEIYRGEFRKSPESALKWALQWLEELDGQEATKHTQE